MNDQAAGQKPYAGNYSFATLLPSEGIAIDFIRLTGDEFMHILDSAENTAQRRSAKIHMPILFKQEVLKTWNAPGFSART